MASSYGWAALGAFILAILVTVLLWIRGWRKQIRTATQAADQCAASKVVADANKAAADAASADPGPTPGIRVRQRPDKPTPGI